MVWPFALSSARSPFLKVFLWISVIHLLQAARNGWKNTFNLWGSQIIKLEASVYSGKLFYIFINSKGTFQLHSLFSKQIIYCQQTPLQQVSNIQPFRELLWRYQVYAYSKWFNPLFHHPLRNPRATLSPRTEHRRSNQEIIFWNFFLAIFPPPSLKISLCWQEPASAQAGICCATYFLPFHSLLMKGYVHVQNKFDSFTETYLSVPENNSWDWKGFFQDKQQWCRNTSCKPQHRQQRW